MKYLLVLTCFIIVCGCHSNTANTTAKDSIASKPNKFEAKEFAGVFFDTIPCADCAGIATRLYLKPDYSFVMEQAYIGKNIVYNLGKWSVTDSILKLAGNEGISQFKVLNYASIKLLDNEGSMQYDTTNAHIILERSNTPFRPQQPVPVEGIFSASGDTMNLHICAQGNNYPVALAPDAMSMTIAYSKAAHQKNEPLYAKLQGHFELRPSLKDTTTRDFFVVEHFVEFVPGQQCK